MRNSDSSKTRRLKCPKCSKSIRVPDSMCGKSGRCPSCGTGVKILLPKPKKNLPDLTTSLPVTTKPVQKPPKIADSINVDPPHEKTRKSLSLCRYYIIAGLSILGLGLHPIFVAMLGSMLAFILGVEVNMHTPAEGSVAKLCQMMMGYHWMALGTLPLMVISFIGLGLIAIVHFSTWVLTQRHEIERERTRGRIDDSGGE